MLRLLSGHHPAANPSLLLPLCPAAGQRGRGGERGGEGLAEAQLPHVFQDGVSPFALGLPTGGERPAPQQPGFAAPPKPLLEPTRAAVQS